MIPTGPKEGKRDAGSHSSSALHIMSRLFLQHVEAIERYTDSVLAYTTKEPHLPRTRDRLYAVAPNELLPCNPAQRISTQTFHVAPFRTVADWT